VQSFAADFAQHCEGFAPALFGQVRFNSQVPIDLESDLPAPFSFIDAVNVPLNSDVISNAVSITGITSAPIRVQGGLYSIDGGPFTNDPGFISNGQSVRLQLRSSSLPGTSTFATVKIGAASATFQTTTPFAPGINILYYHSQPGDFIGAGQQRALYSGTGYVIRPATAPGTIPGRNIQNGVSLTIQGAGNFWTLDLAGPQSAPLAVGRLRDGRALSFNNGPSPGINLERRGAAATPEGALRCARRGLWPPTLAAALRRDFVQLAKVASPRSSARSAQLLATDLIPTRCSRRRSPYVDNLDAPSNALVTSNAVTISGISDRADQRAGRRVQHQRRCLHQRSRNHRQWPDRALRVQTLSFGTRRSPL